MQRLEIATTGASVSGGAGMPSTSSISGLRRRTYTVVLPTSPMPCVVVITRGT